MEGVTSRSISLDEYREEKKRVVDRALAGYLPEQGGMSSEILGAMLFPLCRRKAAPARSVHVSGGAGR